MLCAVKIKKKMTADHFAAWFEEHRMSGRCEKNFDGSANAMEAAAAEILWKRSIDFCKFRYNTILSDGDAKTYKHLQDLKVYGSDIPIQKEECINHISKRLNKGLKNVVDDCKKKGITLGGKKHGSLTEDVITRLQLYYRNAIVENIPNVENMKRAIYATLRHCGSTDQNPEHSSCPVGNKSWCFFNRALENDEQT